VKGVLEKNRKSKNFSEMVQKKESLETNLGGEKEEKEEKGEKKGKKRKEERGKGGREKK